MTSHQRTTLRTQQAVREPEAISEDEEKLEPEKEKELLLYLIPRKKTWSTAVWRP